MRAPRYHGSPEGSNPPALHLLDDLTLSNVVRLAVEPGGLEKREVREAVVADAVALANTGGGWLLLTLKDSEAKPTSDAEHELPLLAQQARLLLLNGPKPPLVTRWSMYRQPHGPAIALEVPSANPLVLTARGEALTRRDDGNVPMPADELVRRLGFLRGQDATPVPSSLDDLSPAAVADFLAHLKQVDAVRDSATTATATTATMDAAALRTLLRLRLARPAYDAEAAGFLHATPTVKGRDDLAPTVAGLLLLGHPDAVSGVLPGARVLVVRYRGLDRDSELGRVVLRDRVPDLVERVVETVTSYARRHVRAAGLYRIDEPEYSERVLRELVVNALAHRRYDVDTSVEVEVFSDRLEIRNPGSPLGALTQGGGPETLDVRNPRLVDGLVTLGLMRGVGTGLGQIAAWLAEAGVPPLEISSAGERTRVVLRGLAVKERIAHALLRAGLGGPGELDERQRRVVALAASRPVTNRDLRAALGVNIATATRILADLTERGVLTREGSGRSTRYTIRVDGPDREEATR